MRPKHLALLAAILLLAYALWQNRSGYSLLPNLLALVGVLVALYFLRSSDGSGGGR